MARPFGTKKIESPEKMWEYFEMYVEHIQENPIQIIEQKKGNVIIPKGATMDEIKEMINPIVKLPARRPLTMEGFENFLDGMDIIGNLTHYFSNLNNSYTDYLAVCQRIRKTIRQDQIEGGMAGIYNPSITQRLNGLVEKTSVEVKAEQPLFPDTKPKDNG